MSEILDQMTAISRKRATILDRLVTPARAAVNAMQDAGMKNTADLLAQVLFEYDSVCSEMVDLMKSDPEAAINALLEALEKRPR